MFSVRKCVTSWLPDFFFASRTDHEVAPEHAADVGGVRTLRQIRLRRSVDDPTEKVAETDVFAVSEHDVHLRGSLERVADLHSALLHVVDRANSLPHAPKRKKRGKKIN